MILVAWRPLLGVDNISCLCTEYAALVAIQVLHNANGGGAVAEWVRASTGRSMVRVPLRKTFRFGTLAIPFTPLCQCLSEEAVKAVGPFYLVSMPGEIKDPTSPHWNV